jgi:hypothetical protein
MAMASLVLKCDLAKAGKKYEKDSSRFIAMAKVRNSDDTPFAFNFGGEICTAGISTNEFTNGKKKTLTYAVGVELEDHSQQHMIFKQIVELAQAELAKLSLNFEYVDLIKDDNKLFIKLKTDSTNKVFSTKTNLSITPKKYSETHDYDQLRFSGEIQVWFNFDDEKYGISLVPKKLEFLKNDEE